METKTAPPKKKTAPAIHPAAAKIPEPSQADYDRLKVDIRKHGQKVPTVFTPDGQILDGRTRDKIFHELMAEGLLPRVCSRVATTEEMLDPFALVLSLNAARRHLTADQIAALYAIDRASADALTRSPRGEGKTSAKIAKKIGSTPTAVERMDRIQKVAPEKLADVAAGKISAKKVLEAKKKTCKAEPGDRWKGKNYEEEVEKHHRKIGPTLLAAALLNIETEMELVEAYSDLMTASQVDDLVAIITRASNVSQDTSLRLWGEKKETKKKPLGLRHLCAVCGDSTSSILDDTCGHSLCEVHELIKPCPACTPEPEDAADEKYIQDLKAKHERKGLERIAKNNALVFEDVKATADAAGFDLSVIKKPKNAARYQIAQRSTSKQPRSWSRWQTVDLISVLERVEQYEPLAESAEARA